MIQVGQEAPEFTAPALLGSGEMVPAFSLYRYLANQMGLLFFYPMDFTFVCPSELIALNRQLHNFEARGVKVLAISTDSIYAHQAWQQLPQKKGGLGSVQFPMIGDIQQHVCRTYGVLHPTEGVALRACLLIDQSGVVRYLGVNDLPIGRSIPELLRIIEALQFHQEHGQVCPVNWERGEKAITPSAQGIADYLSTKAKKL